MKVVRINANELGLVFQRGRLVKVLTDGIYFLGNNQHVEFLIGLNPFSVEAQYKLAVEANVQLMEHAELISITENEIALVYINGIFTRILNAGSYLFLKNLAEIKFQKIDLSQVEFPENIDRAVLSHPLLAPFVRSCTVEAYEKGVLLVDGKLQAILEPGTYYFVKNSIVVLMQKTDLRITQLEITGQEILSADKVALRVNAFASYRVVDVLKALVENRNFEKHLYVQIQLLLRKYLGSLSLNLLLAAKEKIATEMLEDLRSAAAELGVEISDLGIRDLILPGEVRDIMNKVLIAEKQAEANAIMRREETSTTRSLLNTAKLMEDNAMLYRLKEMEYLEKIADKISNISLHGNTGVADQLKQLFAPVK